METQESICEWAQATFGEADSLQRIVVRANEECAELLRAISVQKGPIDIAIEGADIMIVLYRVCAKLDIQAGSILNHPCPMILGYDEHWYHHVFHHALSIQERILLLMTRIEDNAIEDSERPMSLERSTLFLVLSLRRLGEICGIDLRDAIASKMHVNRHEREWKQDGSGHGYHVRTGKA